MASQMNKKFSEEQLKTIDYFVEWINLLKSEPKVYTNRLKIWKALRFEGAEGWLLLEAFRKAGLVK
jgi:hypothetical protein